MQDPPTPLRPHKCCPECSKWLKPQGLVYHLVRSHGLDPERARERARSAPLKAEPQEVAAEYLRLADLYMRLGRAQDARCPELPSDAIMECLRLAQNRVATSIVALDLVVRDWETR